MASSKKWFLGFVIVALAASAFAQESDCHIERAGDSCNTCNVCGGITSCTLAYCPVLAAKDAGIPTFTECDSRFRFRDHEMRIGDLFPEDCGKSDGSITFLSYSWHGVHVLEPFSSERTPPVAEPPDLPAIAEKYLAHHKGDSCNSFPLAACNYAEDQYEKRPTCADKSRILLTAQNGDKWCHKPQTGVTK